MRTNDSAVIPSDSRAVRECGRAPGVLVQTLMWAIVLQAFTAGRILTGDEWARDLHAAGAGILLVAALGGGILTAIRLKDRSDGRRLGFVLIGVGVVLYAQFHLGVAAADGENTLWIHVPLGVALVAALAYANQIAIHLNRRPTEIRHTASAGSVRDDS